MNILVAPNAFKNSLDAQSAADAITMGLMQSKLDCNCTIFPVGDGGDGTGGLLTEYLGGLFIKTPAHDTLGREIIAGFGLVDEGQTAIIEMADACGIRLLNTSELNPMQANSVGAGELIKAALDIGVKKIIIGMGGSATVDGGMGILSALGVQFFSGEGTLLDLLPEKLVDLAVIDTTGLDRRIDTCEIIILCDVDNQLLGDNGAAAVFGPQKGATLADVPILDIMLSKFAAITLQQTGKDITNLKHGGTAGGAAAGLYAFLNAKLVSGADTFLALSNFNAALQAADVVITGEGSIDEQTLQGKAPAVVAALAKAKGIKVIGLAGKVPINPSRELNQYFDMLRSINKEPIELSDALKQTYDNLISTAREIGDSLILN
ncbi:MAG: glycerate kinase [Bacteroidota bacterium]